MKSATRLLLCAAASVSPLLAKPDLVTFGSFTLNATPYPITAAADGNLYGISYAFNGSAAIFRVAPDGGYKAIHSFPRVLGTVVNKTGSVPATDVTLASDGYVYGMTATGGQLGRGVLYRMQSDGKDYNAVDLDPSALPVLATLGTFPAAGAPLIEGADHSFYTTSEKGAIVHVARDGKVSLVLQLGNAIAVLKDSTNPDSVIVVSQKAQSLQAQRVTLSSGTTPGAAIIGTLPASTAISPLRWTPSGLVYFQATTGDTSTVGNFQRLNLDGSLTTLSSITTTESPRNSAAGRVLAVQDDGTVYFSAGNTDTNRYGHTVIALTTSGTKRIIVGFPDAYAAYLLKGPGDSFYSFTTGSALLLPHDDASTWSADWMARANSFHYDLVATPINRGVFFQLSPSGTQLNAPPVATQDLGKTRGANSVFFTPLINDRDPDRNAFSFVDAGPPTTGTISVGAGTAPVINFTPQDNGFASSIIPYRVADTTGATSTGTILVHGNAAGKYLDPEQIVRKQPFSITVAATGRFSAIVPDGFGAYLTVAGNLDARDTGVASARTRNGNLITLALNLSSTGGSAPVLNYSVRSASAQLLSGIATRK